MSHFFAVTEGATIDRDGSERKTRVTRGGNAESGLTAILRSKEGSVVVSVYEGDDGTGGLEDRVRIAFQRVGVFRPVTHGIGTISVDAIGERFTGHDFELYDGPISECDHGSIRWATQESET